MSFVFPLEPRRDEATGQSESDDFDLIRTCLARNIPTDEDHRNAITSLFVLLNKLKRGDALSLKILYAYLFRLLPHFTEKQFRDFCTDHLSCLLSKSTDLHEEHRKLALELGDWKLLHPHHGSLESLLQACREAMDFYVEAIAIAEEHQLEIDETHRRASKPFIKILKFNLEQGMPIKEKVLNATRAWQSDPEKFFACYASIEELVDKLQVFCCDQEDEKDIKEIYWQTLRALNDSTETFQAQPRYADARYPDRLVEKLNRPIPQPKRWPTQRYRDQLIQFRQHFNACTSDNVRDFQEENSGKFISMFQEVYFQDIEAIFLEALPGKHDVRAMGSIGKKEGCRSSDLEYLILIENEKDREV